MIVSNMEGVGKIIREERKRQGFTQGELADLCGVGITFISQLERGKQSVEAGKVLNVLALLGIDVFLEKRTPC